MDVEEVIRIIIDCAVEVRRLLKQGFLENLYKNAMFLEMRSRGLDVQTEVPYDVRYKGEVIGIYHSDLVVNGCVILELKANQALVPANEVQLVNYLNAANIENGLLINFGGERLEIKRKYRTYRPSSFNNIYTQK